MRDVFAQISLSCSVNGNHEEIKEVVTQAMNIACNHIEASLGHENVQYNFTQFKTGEDDGRD